MSIKLWNKWSEGQQMQKKKYYELVKKIHYKSPKVGCK